MATMSMADTESDTNSSDSLATMTSREIMLAIPALCFISLLMVVGTVGNLLVILTYSRNIGKSSTNLFIFCLAALDMVSCCFVLSVEFYNILHPFTNELHYLCSIQKFVSFALDLSSGYIIVCISCDRYMRIVRPHRRLSVCQAYVSVISISVASSVSCSISLFIYGTEEIRTSSDRAILGYRCGIIQSAKDSGLPLLFTTIILVLFGIAVIILLSVYIRLGITVRKWNKERNAKETRQNSYSQPQESSSRFDHSYIEPKQQVETITFAPLQSPGVPGRTARAMNFKRPEFVRQISRSLDQHEFENLFDVHVDGSKTLPSSKHQKVRNSKRLFRRISSRRAGIPSFTNLRKRIKLSKTTIMLIAATVAFVASHVPNMCVMVIHVIRPELVMDMTSVQQSLYRFAEYSFIISYGVNPLIYSFMNPKFRRECYILLRHMAVTIRCRSKS